MAENDKITAPEGPRVRYSDEELEEFRAIINDMLSKARKEYDTLRRVITHGGSNDIEDTAPSFKTVEDDGAFQLTKEEAGQPRDSTSSSRTLRLLLSVSRTRPTVSAV